MSTIPITFTPIPTPPSRNDPVNFRPRGDAFLGALPVLQTEMQTVADVTYSNAVDAETAATNAATSAAVAQSTSEISTGAVNFRGLWTGMTGSLNKPATVKHNGRFWLLLNNLPNVATAEPGVNAAWTSLDAGAPITQVVMSGTVTAVIGVTYILAGATFRLNLPTSGLNKGDYIGIRLATEPKDTQIVNFGSVKLLGKTAGEVILDVNGLTLDLRYENTTYGWV